VIADNIDWLERGFKNVVEWGKANGVPDIMLQGAETVPRSDVTVSDEAQPGAEPDADTT
jgi:hypothetical protein